MNYDVEMHIETPKGIMAYQIDVKADHVTHVIENALTLVQEKRGHERISFYRITRVSIQRVD